MNPNTDLWLTEFRSRYYEIAGVLPILQAGTDPSRDLALIEHIGPGREYWFLYDLSQFDADYWSIFLTLFADRPDLRIEISTAIILTERILGTRAFDLPIPDSWVVCLESLGQTADQSRII
jgi:hypothetical protein